MKKVLAIALLCAVSSFASWSIMAPKGAGKGEAKLGFAYNMIGDDYAMGLNLGARYGIIEGLEAAVMLHGMSIGGVSVPGFTLTSSEDDFSGLAMPVIAVRYFLPMGLGFFADAALPVGSEDIVGKDPEFGLVLGAQFVTNINEQLAFGSQLGITHLTDDADVDLDLAAEVDYNLGAAIPLVRLDLGGLIGDFMAVQIKPGVKFPINDMIIVDALVGLCVAGDGCPEDDMPINIGANVGVHF